MNHNKLLFWMTFVRTPANIGSPSMRSGRAHSQLESEAQGDPDHAAVFYILLPEAVSESPESKSIPVDACGVDLDLHCCRVNTQPEASKSGDVDTGIEVRGQERMIEDVVKFRAQLQTEFLSKS